MKIHIFNFKCSLLILSIFTSTIAVSQTTVSNDNFNSNWGIIWNDGGGDCVRVSSSSIDGTGAIQLRDDSGAASSMYTNNINLSSFGSASIDFNYRTQGFWWGLDFFVEYSSNGGSTWVTIGNYANPDISDYTNYSASLTIASSNYTFNSTSRFRIRCDASQDSNQLYIDNVVIKGYAPAPEMDVKGNGYSIVDGDTTPWLIDNTDYGSANAGIIITRTFTIHNTGTATLNISGISLSNTTDYDITISPASTVAVDGSTTFAVRFRSLTLGLKSTSVTINNNDPNENPYNFVINAKSEQNFFDSDGDGVFDNVDIDDDNDGILDSVEELACKNSSFSITTNYKFLNETFGTGNRTQINTTYDAITTYNYEDGTDGGNGIDLNDGKYTVYYRAANGDGINQTPNAEVSSWADQYWYLGTDHTPGDTNGRMAMFNASYEPGLFYTASIKGSLPNVPVTYSFWALNLDRTDAPGIGSRLRPNIKVEFRDVNNNLLTSITTGDIAPTTAGNLDGDWYNFSASLTFNVSEFNVYFINNEVGGLGNDLAIDDIEITQTLCDTDNDGVADLFDLDSDNDGIPDVVEAGLGILSQGKATLTYASGWIDTNGNGMDDRAEANIPLDSDGDGTPNYLDLDSDNDAIFDVDESGAGNSASSTYQNGDGDIDGDGVGDGPDTDAVRKKDFNSDGTVEYFTDGILNIYDYKNGSTLAAAYGNSNQGIGNTYFVKDTDNDGIPDYMDITSDGSTFDISHTLYAHLDGNNNGRVDGNSDAEGDGLLDLFDTDDTAFGSPRDLDSKLHLFFDGRNDYAQDVSVINGWGEATMMTWIKTDITNSGNSRIMGQNQFYLEWQSSRKVKVYANGNFLISDRLTPGRWIHIATSYSSSSGLLKLYINGEEVRSSAISGSLPADASLFTLAKNSVANNYYYKGYLDEVRVFQKALSSNEIQKMVYQEIQNNSGNVRGAIIPRDITNYVNSTTITPLTWSSLKRYYKMDTFKGDIIDDLTTASVDVNSGLKIYNNKLIESQNAPLPFITNQSGALDAAVDKSADGVIGTDVIDYDWSIVHVTNKDVTCNGTQKHLGLMIDQFDASASPIEYKVDNDSELNVSWYLKMDGDINLQGESQLVQGDDSQLDPTSKGKLKKYQQGTADKFTYNYWSSPVGVSNITTNNNSYRVRDIMKDGANNINWLTSGHNGTNTSPIGIADYWIWKFANLPDNSYASWQHVRSTGTMRAGEGFTMKGPGTGSILTEQEYLFDGKPNNGDIDLTLNAGNDYLVGNPYPSAIDGIQFILDNGNTIAGNGSTSGTLYFWEHWGGGSHNLGDYQGGYATYNLSGGTPSASFGTNDPDVATGGSPTKIPGRYIPVGQGFFVVAEGSGGTIKFRNSQRIFVPEGSSSSVYIRNEDGTTAVNYNPDGEDTRMKFRIGFNSVNTIHRQILLTVDSNATDGIDWGYDASYIDTQMDDMYWMISEEKFNIQARDTITKATVVPLGLHLRNGGESKISIDLLENVPGDVEIFLHDKSLDTYHNLRQDDYRFSIPAGTYLDRFEITFHEGEVLSVEDNDYTALEVYYANTSEHLVLVNPTLRTIKSIELFNILGQSVYFNNKVDIDEYSEYKVENLNTGTYIIKLTNESGTTSKKVLVK
ncbi:MAG: LamG-like jellyroll fold domain-containing protein [Aquaticitalea sp.]